jgi:hypothetical protein
LFLSQVTNLNPFNVKGIGLDSLQVSIRASSEADYSHGQHNYRVPPISEKILNQIIAEIPATGSPQDRMGTLQAALLTPVPSMTPDLRLTAAFSPSPSELRLTSLANSPTSAAFTMPAPTATPGLSPTPTITYTFETPTLIEPTSTPTPQPATMTPTPTATLANTPTPIPPVPTNTPKPANTPGPTNTPKPANTPGPTNTPKPANTPGPTNTPKHTPKPTHTPKAH